MSWKIIWSNYNRLACAAEPACATEIVTDTIINRLKTSQDRPKTGQKQDFTHCLSIETNTGRMITFIAAGP